MRIIFFNVWHGHVWDGLKRFLVDQSVKTDIFCLLEVDPNLQLELERLLPDFTPVYYRGVRTNYLNGIREGRSIFVRNGTQIIKTGAMNLFKVSSTDAGGFQFAHLKVNGKNLFIGEVHGKAQPGDKKDTKIRIKQSQTIIDYFKDKNGPKIIGGDFNLLPDTKSVTMFEKMGYRNLIREFGIKSTRNQLTWNHFGNVKGFVKQYFADYCFISKDVKVIKFEVSKIEVSDHLPLILDFEI